MGPQLREDDRFLPARSVWERYGVTSLSLYRWLADEGLAFPRPVYVGRFRYWRLSDLIAWEMGRPNVGKPFRALAHAEEVADP
jgi:predicted DNA-binding transcriptional regulator AlpA